MIRPFIAAFLLVASFTANTAVAAIILEVEDTTIVEGTGGAVVNVFIRSDVGDEPIAITADFEISNADFLDPPGVFDQAGFFNQGNYNNASSFFLRDTVDPSLAFLSLDIETAAEVPGSETLLAQLFIDSQALAVGAYDIDLSNVFVFDSSAQVPASGLGGTLTVAAVPEPTTIFALGTIGCLAAARARRRRR